MPHIAGKGGSVESQGGEVLGVSNWELTFSGDTPESTGFDSSGHREYIAGLDGWTATLEAHWDTTLPPHDSGVNEPDFNPGATVAIELFLVAAGDKYNGNAIVTEVSVSAPVDGIIDYSVSLQGTGPLTVP